jgi:hypothetical protein
MAEIFSQVSFSLSCIKIFTMRDEGFQEKSTWQADIDPTELLEILLRFDSVHTMYISRGLRSSILLVLQRHDEESAGVLPALQDLYLGGYELSGSNIELFITERQRSNRPVTVHSWEGMMPHGDKEKT